MKIFYNNYKIGDEIDLDDDDMRIIEENEKEGNMLFIEYNNWNDKCVKHIGESMIQYGNQFVDEPKILDFIQIM